jgi:Tfp pilus assembly protein FimV
MKMPAYRAEILDNKIDDELDLLESADVYLRFDNFKLAAESVREAIQLNPTNAQSHLKLLGILESQNDEAGFAKALQALKELGDADAWREAMEMGSKFKAPVAVSHVDFDLG